MLWGLRVSFTLVHSFLYTLLSPQVAQRPPPCPQHIGAGPSKGTPLTGPVSLALEPGCSGRRDAQLCSQIPHFQGSQDLPPLGFSSYPHPQGSLLFLEIRMGSRELSPQPAGHSSKGQTSGPTLSCAHKRKVRSPANAQGPWRVQPWLTGV